MLSPDQIREMNEAYRRDYNRHDAGALRKYYADRVNWTNPSVPQPITDADQIPKQVASIFAAFPDLRIEFLDDFSEGYHNVHHWVTRGTNTGPLGEGADQVPPTGRAVTVKGLTMLVMNEDGKIVDDHTYFDTSSLNRQLGLA